MAAPLLLRQVLLLRACLHSHTARAVVARHRLWCSAATNSPSNEAEEKAIPSTTFNLRSDKYKSNPPRWEDDPDYRKWRVKEEEILKDIEPIILLTKDILHSRKYMDGQRLSVEDEKDIVEKLLAYHPHSEDKIGPGLESIMVDRHPQFRHSRCLFVVRTDGGWIDFSYQKCLRKYIRDKYPIHAERFIREHFKRGSG